MGRVTQSIDVDGRACWTLFDTGSLTTYVTPPVAQLLTTSPMPRPLRTGLGGGVKEANAAALLVAEIALAMQQWGIRTVPDKERIDLSHYPEMFVEFSGID